MRTSFALVLLLTCSPALFASEVLLVPGEQATIHFQFAEPPLSASGQPVNILAFVVGGSYVDFLGQSLVQQKLSDGGSTLGERQALREEGMSARFVSADAPWSGIEIDFEPIVNGSIQGAMMVRPVFDIGSTQSRIRFRGRLITGHVSEGGQFSPGPDADIIGCHIDARIFRDRFDSGALPPANGSVIRDCDFGVN